jgi:folate-binding protein YgfZ
VPIPPLRHHPDNPRHVNDSPLLPIHLAAGARMTDPASGPPALLTYGDVPAEYRAGMEGALLFDETTRGCLRVQGSDATTFLHRLLANDVKGLEPDQGNRNLLLSAKGKTQHEFDLVPLAASEGPGYTLITPPGLAAGLAVALDMYLFSDDVQLVDVSADFAALAISGPTAANILEEALGIVAPDHPYRPLVAEWQGSPITLVALTVAGSPGWRIEADSSVMQALWTALTAGGAQPGGLVARDALRVEAGQGLFGVDLDDTVYPQEARLEDAFSLSKGCYIGQEVVAKIDTYGGLNKCLFGLSVDHDDPVQAGTRLVRDVDGESRDLGVVTSWSYSFVLDTGMVLAYVKRKHQATGTAFRLGDTPGTATIVEMPVRSGSVPFTGGAMESADAT